MTDNTRRLSVPFELSRTDESGSGLTMEGYAAVFNSPTLIESWEGRFNETIAPGAFAKTIREGSPVLQFDHGQHPLLGSIPLGAITDLQEDETGLRVRARISDNWLTEPIRDAIREGAIDGMSFRFIPVKDEWEDERSDTPTRTLREVKLLELGPVVFPAYADTSVSLRDAVDDQYQLARALVFGQREEPTVESHSSQEDTEPTAVTLDRKADISRAIREIQLASLKNKE